MRPLLLAALAALLAGCGDRGGDEEPRNYTRAEIVDILTPLIDPAKLDALKGERAATPRLRKICYWLETARRTGYHPPDLLAWIHETNNVGGIVGEARDRAQRDSLLRNGTILEKLGCFGDAGMAKLRRGKAPTITRKPYVGELATGDHIIPRSVCPELDNKLYNLEFLPDTLNKKKGAKIGDRQRQLAQRWHDAGLLSDEGLAAVVGVR